ncbi:MAG: hypothetical protein QM749_02550 [Aquabacterium sp.]
MTAIVAGQGLGLVNTSAGVLGEQGQVGVASQGRSGEKVAVNAANGNLVIEQQDEWLVGIGPDVTALRTYNSQANAADDDNGDNWRLGLSRKISGANGAATVTRTAEDGHIQTFSKNADGSYTCREGGGSFDTLKWDATNAVWTWTGGDTQVSETYELLSGTDYRLRQITDADGHSVRLTYTDPSGVKGRLIKTIATWQAGASSATESIDIVYDTAAGKSGNILSMTTNTAQGQVKRVSYLYDSNGTAGRLKQVTVDLTPTDQSDNRTYVTAYTYDGTSNRIKTLVQSDGSTSGGQLVANSQLSFDYEASGAYRVTKVTETIGADTRVTSLDYTSGGAGVTRIYDPLNPIGNAQSVYTELGYDTSAYSGSNPKAGQLTYIKAPAVGGVSQLTTFQYDASGNVSAVTDARGNTTVYHCDANGNRTYQRDALGNVVERAYSAKNQLLSETAYTVADPDGDGSALPSGAMTTRYVYNDSDSGNAQGVHLRFVLSPTGMVTEYRYNSLGQRVASLQYTAATYNLASTPNPTDSQLATWAGTAANVAKVMRVDYAYDTRGQLKTQTAFANTDATGVGLADGKQSITQYVYDQAGNLLKKIDGRANGQTGVGYTTVYTYDGLNRITSMVEPQADGSGRAITTVTAYDDKLRTTTVYRTATPSGGSAVKVDGGATSVSTYDEAGELLSVASTANTGGAALGTVSYTYDKLGRLAMLTDAVGNKTYWLYDAAGRKVGEINAEGALTEYRYNADNQLTRTIGYATPVGASQLATLEAGQAQASVSIDTLRPAANTLADRNSWNVYDAAGQLVTTVSSTDSMDGMSTEVLSQVDYSYDGAHRLSSKKAYILTLSSGIATLEALTAQSGELRRGSDGIYLGTTRILRQPVGTTLDRLTRCYYNDSGLLIGQLDPENYYTQNTYDGAGRLTQVTRYATAIDAASVPAGNTPPTPVPNAVLGAIGQDQKTKYFYNGKGQLAGTVDPGNGYTAYEYDAAGNRTKETRYATVVANSFDGSTAPTTSANDRVTSYTYDSDNRLLTSTSSPSGQVVTNTYDALGNLTSTSTTIKATGQSDQVRAIQRRYDAMGRVTAELTAEGAKALIGKTLQADIDTVWNTYATRYVYDNAGRRTAMIEPNGVNTTGNQTVYYYDKAGRLTHSINALGEIQQYVYDAFGERTEARTVNARLGASTVAALTGGSQSALGTAVSSLLSATLDNVLTSSYTRAGQLSYTTQQALSTKNYVFSPGDIRSYLYDGLGNLIEQDSNNQGGTLWTSYSYDRRGLRTLSEDAQASADGLSATWLRNTQAVQYDAFGRVMTATDSKGASTSYCYDRLGRVLLSEEQGSAGGVARTYAYDAFGRVLTATEPGALATQYVYDDVNRQITITTAQGSVTVRTLDSAGQSVSLKDANGNTTKYTYDADGRLLTTSLYAPDGSTLVAGTSSSYYDTAGHVWQTQDANGVITQLGYDKASRVITRTVDVGGLNLKTSYHYDTKGQAVWVQDANGVWTNTTYDRKGRVSKIVVDPASIPQTGTADDAAADQLSLVGNPAVGGALARTTQYSYDDANHVTQVTQGTGANLQVTQYQYDVLGRRISETVDPVTAGNPNGLKLKTSYTYDSNDNVVVKVDANGNYSYYAYDSGNRLTYTVDGTGAVTRNEYDIDGRISRVTAYAARITLDYPAQLAADPTKKPPTGADIAAKVTANATLDHTTWYVHDKDGRLTHTIDAKGGVTELTYDANGNVTRQTRYATATTMGAGTVVEDRITFAKPTLTSTAQDQVTRTVFDAANRPVWSIDALNGVTRRTYDASGNVTQVKRYYNTATAFAADGTPTVADDTQTPSRDSSSQCLRYGQPATFVIDARELRQREQVRQRATYCLARAMPASSAAAMGAPGAHTAPSERSTSGLSSWVFKAAASDTSKDAVTSYGWDAVGEQTTQSTSDAGTSSPP